MTYYAAIPTCCDVKQVCCVVTQQTLTYCCGGNLLIVNGSVEMRENQIDSVGVTLSHSCVNL